MQHVAFVHPSMDGHVCGSHFLAVMNRAATDSFLWQVFPLPLGGYLGAELLGPVALR